MTYMGSPPCFGNKVEVILELRKLLRRCGKPPASRADFSESHWPSWTISLSRSVHPCLHGARRERDSKNLVAFDFGKRLRRFWRLQGQNRRRHFATGHPIDRRCLTLAQLDPSRSRGRDRGPNTGAGWGLPVIDRDALAGQIGYRFDFRAGQENRNQMVSVVRRPSRGLFGVAAHSFRMVGTVGVVSFRFRRWDLCGGGTACRTRIPVLRPLCLGAGNGVACAPQI